MPMTVKPLSAYSFCSSTKCGISIRQGAHQVAQKFRITILRRKSENFTVLPFKSFSCQPGAGFPASDVSCARARAVLEQTNPTASRAMRETLSEREAQ